MICSFRDALIITILLTIGISVSAVKAENGLVETPVAGLPITLTYDPALVRPHAITPNEKKYSDEADDGGVTVTYVLEARLHLRSQRYFVIVCSSGGSADYTCSFKPVGSTRDIVQNQLEGLRFEIPGDYCVYASGHNNTMFDNRRKYCVDEENQLQEIKQPFHYVGLKSKTLRDLTFYSDKEATNAVGTIPKGEFVEVLVASVRYYKDGPAGHDYFLVRDKNGLTGWVELRTGQEAEDIEGMFFAGD